MTFAENLVHIASREVGVEEVNGTNCGPRVDQYKAATNLPPHESWAWCAAFVCWCVKQTLESCGIPETETFRRPTTAGAWDFENWSKRQDDTTWTSRDRTDLAVGDIIIFTFSHIGICSAVHNNQTTIQTIEGNTDSAGSREGGGVFRKTRPRRDVKARIRFRLP